MSAADPSRRQLIAGALIAVTAALIGAGGTVAGVLVSNQSARWSLNQELRQQDSIRQADLRREAYQDFFHATADYYYILRETNSGTRTANGFGPKDFKEKRLELNKALNDVSILGSETAFQFADQTCDTLFAMTASVSQEDLERMRQKANDELSKFTVAIRPELKSYGPLPELR